MMHSELKMADWPLDTHRLLKRNAVKQVNHVLCCCKGCCIRREIEEASSKFTTTKTCNCYLSVKQKFLMMYAGEEGAKQSTQSKDLLPGRYEDIIVLI